MSHPLLCIGLDDSAGRPPRSAVGRLVATLPRELNASGRAETLPPLYGSSVNGRPAACDQEFSSSLVLTEGDNCSGWTMYKQARAH